MVGVINENFKGIDGGRAICSYFEQEVTLRYQICYASGHPPLAQRRKGLCPMSIGHIGEGNGHDSHTR